MYRSLKLQLYVGVQKVSLALRIGMSLSSSDLSDSVVLGLPLSALCWIFRYLVQNMTTPGDVANCTKMTVFSSSPRGTEGGRVNSSKNVFRYVK